MNATRTSLTKEEIATVLETYKVYKNTGTVGTGKWVYQPHDFDGSFELWSDTFATKREALVAAWNELATEPNL